MKNLLQIKTKLKELQKKGTTHFQIPTSGGPNFKISEVIEEINNAQSKTT